MLKVFIRKSVFTVSLNILILLLGVFTIPYLSNEFIPSIEIPAVAVAIPLPLMDKKRIVNQVAKPIEKAFISVENLKSIETRIEKDVAIFILFYDWSLSPSKALRRSRETISNIKLPEEALKPIFVLHRPSNNPILRFTYYGENYEKIGKYSKDIASRLERIPGVSQVNINGLIERKTNLNVDPVQISRANINASDILLNARKNWSLRAFVHQSDLSHYISYPIESHTELGNLQVKNKKGNFLQLSSLGEIKQELDQPELYFGKDTPAVSIEVIKSPGADTITIVKEALTISDSEQDATRKFKVIYNEALKIVQGQEGMIQNFLIGVFLNSLILMTFLGSSVGVLVASVVFPTSILGTFFTMKYLGISVNLFSLNGFSLAVGMITDASTVVLESIIRKIQANNDIFESCWKGAKEVGMGVVASTLTTAGVLLPIAMQKNVSSKLFSDLSLTVVSTQLVCLIAVFSLVPWLCNKMLSSNQEPRGIIKSIYSLSSKLVQLLVGLSYKIQKKALENKRFRLAFPLTITFLSLGSIYFIPKTEFLPAVSSKVFSIYYPISRSQMHIQAESVRKKLAEIFSSQENVVWSMSKKTKDGIELQVEFDSALTKAQIRSILTDNKIDSQKVNAIAVGPAPSGEALGYSGLYFISNNLNKDQKEELTNNLCNIEGVVKCLTEDHLLLTQSRLKPDHIKTNSMGLTSIESATQIVLPTRKIDLITVGDLEYSGNLILKVSSPSNLLDSAIEVGSGWQSRLGSLFKNDFESQSSVLQRINGREYTPVYFKIKDTTIGYIDNFVDKLKNKFNLLKSDLLGKGQLETMNETFTSMIKALTFSAFIVFAVLVLQFQSISQALVIMATIPLTLGGAIFGLVVMNETVNASVMVGFILLVGIIVNNGIFLVEATNMKFGQKMSLHEAVKGAVEDRTRPILMTSFSTIFGMLPVLILGGEGSELYRGMAIVNVFGMIVGTLLSIIVTPLFIEYLAKPKINARGEQ